MAQQDDLKTLIIARSRELQLLREQVARNGDSVEPSALMEVEDIETSIKELYVQLDDIQPPEDAQSVRHNLEKEPPYFFGRERILESLVQELLGLNQAIILKGIGGVGKSTLAIKIAYKCLRSVLFRTLVWVDLRRYHETQRIDLNAVLDIIARVCDPNSTIAQLGDLQQKSDEIIRNLAQHDTLVIFDNFESVIHDEAGTAICEFINRLPMMAVNAAGKGSSLVRVIITTREMSDALENLQPRIHSVEALTLEDTEKLIDRKRDDLAIAWGLKSKYMELYALTCGIPKLIEFAVGQARYLSFDNIGKDFQFRPPAEGSDEIYNYLFRQSWETTLTVKQQQVLMSMTFFVEHASSEALAATARLNTDEFAQCVKSLCDMSLLDAIYHDDGPVYRIHPLTQKMCEAHVKTSRDFAESAAERFVQYYLQFSEHNYRSNQVLMEHEIKNIVAAIEVAKEIAAWNLLIEFRNPTNHFMWLAGYWRERVAANKSILKACRETANESLEAKILVEDLGFTYLRFEELETAERYVNAGLEIYRRLNDKRGVARATRHLGKSALLKGEYELYDSGRDWRYYFQQSAEFYSASLSVREELSRNDPHEEIEVADLELDFGRLDWLWGKKCEKTGRRNSDQALLQQALTLYTASISVSEQAKARCQKLDHARGLSKAFGNLGNVMKQMGLYDVQEGSYAEAESRFDEAHSFYAQSLQVAQQINKTDEIAHAKWGLAEIYELFSDRKGDSARYLALALDCARDSNRLYRRMATPADIRVTQELVDRIQGKCEKIAKLTPNALASKPKRNHKKNAKANANVRQSKQKRLAAESSAPKESVSLQRDPDWNFEGIRALLNAALNDEELTTLCYDHFHGIYEALSAGMSKNQKIQILLEHCERNIEVERLLEIIQAQNSQQYLRFEPRLRVAR